MPARTHLSSLATFARAFDAMVWVTKMKVPAAALIAAATNEPDAALVRDFQGALRARYDERDWLETLRPINDEMRSLQRDALVAHILHHMRSGRAPMVDHLVFMGNRLDTTECSVRAAMDLADSLGYRHSFEEADVVVLSRP